MLKVCDTCGVEKPCTAFSRRDSGSYRPACKACRSNVSAVRRYGVSVGEVEALAEKQCHCCAICGTHKSALDHAAFKHNPLVIDHCHDTGKVRGLLCPTCNLLLGHAKDNPALLTKAIAYLS